MKVRWNTGDTPGKVEYLDYGAIQQALQADPGALEVLYGLDDPDAPGSAEGDAEQAPERVRHPGAAPDLAEQQETGAGGPFRTVPGHGADAADAGRVGPTVAHTTEAFDPGQADFAPAPGAPVPERSGRELSFERAKEVADAANAKTQETTAQAKSEEKEAAAAAEGASAPEEAAAPERAEEPQRRGPGRPRKE
jgi:hypothetical protein